MVVDLHEAHTLESRKEGDVRNSILARETSLLRVTQSSTVVAWASVFSRGSHNHYELLHEALRAGITINTLFIAFWSL